MSETSDDVSTSTRARQYTFRNAIWKHVSRRLVTITPTQFTWASFTNQIYSFICPNFVQLTSPFKSWEDSSRNLSRYQGPGQIVRSMPKNSLRILTVSCFAGSWKCLVKWTCALGYNAHRSLSRSTHRWWADALLSSKVTAERNHGNDMGGLPKILGFHLHLLTKQNLVDHGSALGKWEILSNIS